MLQCLSSREAVPFVASLQGLSTQYEQNLVALIKQLRVQYNAPKAKFVTASLGQSGKKTPAICYESQVRHSSHIAGLSCSDCCVLCSLSRTVMGATDGGGLILDAMMNVANGTKFPEFAGALTRLAFCCTPLCLQ